MDKIKLLHFPSGNIILFCDYKHFLKVQFMHIIFLFLQKLFYNFYRKFRLLFMVFSWFYCHCYSLIPMHITLVLCAVGYLLWKHKQGYHVLCQASSKSWSRKYSFIQDPWSQWLMLMRQKVSLEWRYFYVGYVSTECSTWQPVDLRGWCCTLFFFTSEDHPKIWTHTRKLIRFAFNLILVKM